MLQHEADEDVVEGPGVEGQVEDVRLPELDVGEAGPSTLPAAAGERLGGDVDRREARLRAVPGQGDGLRADAAPRLEHRLPAGYAVSECRRSTSVPA